MTLGRSGLSIAGRWLTALGAINLAVYAGVLIHRAVSSRLALREFDRAQAVLAHEGPPDTIGLSADEPVDFSLWSKNRVRAYNESQRIKKGSPAAVLRFERLNLRVPVFAGTDDLTLNRGAGWIPGTARPGEAGNIGIAGHRDGFFRKLRHAERGDTIELSTVDSTATYCVDQIQIVNPEDVAVLRPRAVPSLTLVTCYPFYFVGDAPRRFIVQAALKVISRH